MPLGVCVFAVVCSLATSPSLTEKNNVELCLKACLLEHMDHGEWRKVAPNSVSQLSTVNRYLLGRKKIKVD